MEQAQLNPQEQIPETFPIIEDEKKYSLEEEEEPEITEGSIFHFTQTSPDPLEGEAEKYLLLKTIGKYHYLFSLAKITSLKGYYLSWKTREYEYARTSLNEEETGILTKTAQAFLNSVYPQVKKTGEEIKAVSAVQSYTSEDIDQCKKEICTLLRSPDEYLNNHQVDDIFELYKEVTGKSFEDKETKKSTAYSGFSQAKLYGRRCGTV